MTRSEITSKAGSSTSPAKKKTAKLNGKRGGRPRLPDSQLSPAALIKRRQRAKSTKSKPA